MALIDHIDGVNRDIYLSAATVGASVHPMDIYKEYRTLRFVDETLRVYNPMMLAKGNESKGGGAFTERYVVLLSGARFIPYNVSHTLTITGTVITDDGQSGIACFDRSPLSTTTNVNINYVPPQVEVVTVTVSTGSGLSSQQDATLNATLNAAQAGTATEVWSKQIEGTYTAEQVLRLMASVLGGKLTGAGSGYEIFRDLADTKDRVRANIDNSGNRLAVVLDAT